MKVFNGFCPIKNTTREFVLGANRVCLEIRLEPFRKGFGSVKSVSNLPYPETLQLNFLKGSGIEKLLPNLLYLKTASLKFQRVFVLCTSNPNELCL